MINSPLYAIWVALAPEEGGEDPTIMGFVTSFGPILALILTPILGWLATRKRDKPATELNLVQEVQEERDGIRTERNDLRKLLEDARQQVSTLSISNTEYRMKLIEVEADRTASTRLLGEAQAMLATTNLTLGQVQGELAAVRGELVAVRGELDSARTLVAQLQAQSGGGGA